MCSAGGLRKGNTDVNIDDITDVQVPKQDLVPEIFKHQHELMVKYGEIERRNGANFPTPPWNVNDKFVQWHLKDLFWRVTEELAEALDGGGFDGMLGWRDRWEQTDVRHFFEELADALHFLVEASLMADLKPVGVETLWDDIWAQVSKNRITLPPEKVDEMTSAANIEGWCAQIVWALGLTANTLKNKPWKQTMMPTDLPAFLRNLVEAWEAFIGLWCDLGCSKQDVYALYFRKKKVNEFRQRSNY